MLEMAALISTLKVTQKLGGVQKMALIQATRTMAGWNKDYKPDKYPESDKQRLAAAKKYYLLPEEYRTYPDDGLGFGDYPKIKSGLGIEAKDPYYPYDYPEHKRNFNEPVHAEIDLYGEDRYSQSERPRYSNGVYWLSFLGVMTAWFAIYWWLDDKRMFRPVAAKQYPGDGRKHYTFEQE